MRETTKQNLSILTITILVIATVYIFINFINPLIKEINEVRKKIVEEQEKIKLLQEHKSKSEALIQNYLNLKEEKSKIDYALPDSSQTAQVLALIDNLSQKNGCAVKGINFKERKEADKNILEVRIDFSSSYEAVKAFLGDLEKELRLLDVDKVNLRIVQNPKELTGKELTSSKSKKKKSTPVAPTLEVNLTIDAYYLGEEEI